MIAKGRGKGKGGKGEEILKINTNTTNRAIGEKAAPKDSSLPDAGENKREGVSSSNRQHPHLASPLKGEERERKRRRGILRL
jgi:hypothetical protein